MAHGPIKQLKAMSHRLTKISDIISEQTQGGGEQILPKLTEFFDNAMTACLDMKEDLSIILRNLIEKRDASYTSKNTLRMRGVRAAGKAAVAAGHQPAGKGKGQGGGLGKGKGKGRGKSQRGKGRGKGKGAGKGNGRGRCGSGKGPKQAKAATPPKRAAGNGEAVEAAPDSKKTKVF